MPRFLNPPTAPFPASRYSQAVAVGAQFKRLVISGQVGLSPGQNGVLAEGLEAQMEQAFDNLIAIVESAEMKATDIIKIVTYVTVPGQVAIYRKVRDAKLGKHAPASTYLEVAGLASPAFLVEVEGEAIREA